MNIENVKKIIQDDKIIFLTYGGFINQTLIVAMTEALEHEAKKSDLDSFVSNNIFVNFIEIAQNIVKYSKQLDNDSKNLNSEGLIVVGKDDLGNYYIHSQNIVSKEDKEVLSKKLNFIRNLNPNEVRKKYKELRRSGKNTHEKGGGIGFYEIAKRSENINFGFSEINKERFYFDFELVVNAKRTENENFDN